MRILLAYLRKSFYNDASAADRAAVARRRVAIEEWAKHNGPFRLEWFEDLDKTGRYEEGRPDWARLLEQLDRPGVWGVAIEDWRDCHRNVKEFLQFYDDHLAPRGLHIMCLNHPSLNPGTADGRMLITNLMAINEWESRKYSERKKAAIRYRQEVQGRHWGRLPFGCARDPETKHLIPSPTAYWLNPTTGETGPLAAAEEPPPGCERRYFFDALHALFTLFATGHYSQGDAANWLNAAGWRAWKDNYRQPHEFNRFNLYAILKRWYTYAGMLLPYQEPKYGVQPTQQAGHAPILPVELCQAVAAALEQRHTMRAAYRPLENLNHRVFILSGVLFCANCGQRLSGQQTQRYLYYRHTYLKGQCDQKAIPALPLEREILDGLIKLTVQTELLVDVIDELRTILTLAADDDTGDLARLEQAKTERDRLIDLYTQGLITMPEFTRRRDALAAEITRLETQTASHPARALAETETIPQILGYIHRLDEAEPMLQKSLLFSLVQRIEIRDGQITGVSPQPWATPLFAACRVWSKVESPQQLLQIPAWLLTNSTL